MLTVEYEAGFMQSFSHDRNYDLFDTPATNPTRPNKMCMELRVMMRTRDLLTCLTNTLKTYKPLGGGIKKK